MLGGRETVQVKIKELQKKFDPVGILTHKTFRCRNLRPVTQLYVSVDASTKESLKKIDRPLFRDFWPRFLDSLEALADKVRIRMSETTNQYYV